MFWYWLQFCLTYNFIFHACKDIGMMFSESFVEHEQVGGCQVPEVTFVSRQMSLLFQPVVASGVNDTAVVGKIKSIPFVDVNFNQSVKVISSPIWVKERIVLLILSFIC